MSQVPKSAFRKVLVTTFATLLAASAFATAGVAGARDLFRDAPESSVLAARATNSALQRNAASTMVAIRGERVPNTDVDAFDVDMHEWAADFVAAASQRRIRFQQMRDSQRLSVACQYGTVR